MDTEGQDVPLISPLPGTVDSIKVFPFIVHLKRDVIVSQRQLALPFLFPTFFSHPILQKNIGLCPYSLDTDLILK
jgi:hypothetical protein